MKSMTFGKMPAYSAFKKAFDAELPGGEYKMTLRGIDKVTASPTIFHTGNLGPGWFSAREVYDGVKELMEIFDSNIDAPTAHWSVAQARQNKVILVDWEREDPDNRYSIEELRENAGSLASSIMQTLGYEWI